MLKAILAVLGQRCCRVSLLLCERGGKRAPHRKCAPSNLARSLSGGQRFFPAPPSQPSLSFLFPLLFPAAYTSPYSATASHRLLSTARASLVGMTNMDEFGMGSSTAYSVHGPSYNPFSVGLQHCLDASLPRPWLARGEGASDAASPSAAGAPQPSSGAAPAHAHASASLLQEHALTPGGSSGGSAIAVATGAAAAALGSDTGGSVRLPAAFCGVVGFKPTYGAVSRFGLIAYASSLDTIGWMTRSVSDAALLWDVLGGGDGRDATSARGEVGTLSAAAALKVLEAHRDDYAVGRLAALPASHAASPSLAGVRIGLPRQAMLAELPSYIASAWEASATALAGAGAVIQEVDIPHWRQALACYYVTASVEAASNLARYDGVRYGHRAEEGGSGVSSGSGGTEALHALYTASRTQGFGAEVQRRLLVGTFASSRAAKAEFYAAATAVRRALVADFDAAFTSVDALLLPAAPTLPWRSASTARQDPMSLYANDVMTVPPSLAGLPSLALPVSSAPYPTSLLPPGVPPSPALRLPVALQLVGRRGEEGPVLRLGRALETLLA